MEGMIREIVENQIDDGFYLIEVGDNVSNMFEKSLDQQTFTKCNSKNGQNTLTKQAELSYCKQCPYRTVDLNLLERHSMIHDRVNTKIFNYTCSKCKFVCDNINDFERHKLQHVFQCDQCNYTCDNPNYLKRHQIKHSENRSYPCRNCKKLFKTQTHLRQHEWTHERCHKCNLCGETFQFLRELKNHHAVHSDGLEYFSCGYCGHMSFTEKDLKNHGPCLSDEYSHVCECGLKFKYPYKLQKHISKCHSDNKKSIKDMAEIKNNYLCNNDNEKEQINNLDIKSLIEDDNSKNRYNFCCSECGRHFKLKHHLAQHMLTHRKYKCTICKVIFYSVREFKMHTMTHEEIRYMLPCDVCGFLCSTLEELTEHHSSHVNNKKYICEVCGLRFLYPVYLLRHKRTHINVKTPYNCNFCNYLTSQRFSFQKHMKNAHQINDIALADNKLRIFKCDSCDYSSNRKFNLIAHKARHVPINERQKTLNKHESKKVFFCRICEYTSTKIVNLKSHMLTHKKDKHFKCDKCNFTCTLYKYLKDHQVTHARFKPFLCHHCSRTFRRWRDLKIHSEVHDVDNILNCKDCDYICLNQNAMKKHVKLEHVNSLETDLDNFEVGIKKESNNQLLPSGDVVYVFDINAILDTGGN